ncbi:hypothetical protein [Hydrogenophaga taeniospiralis]|uniref:hypothetical protein n=1 Tax=Hydrogenophaga taeniospiralis TaxID=65656 RepID=UPI001CFA2C7F|nr:hypothetical protein [Hydrogenophaga taeniospiralis]UCU92656.1 hypothetical protein KI616_17705 [Hydrogenophaga taeniospiralis]
MKKPVFLVYEPGESYDGGMEPLLVCSTEPAATHAADQITAFAARLKHRVDALDVWEEGIPDEEYARREAKRTHILQRARWPFGVKRSEYSTLDIAAKVMQLPFAQKVA